MILFAIMGVSDIELYCDVLWENLMRLNSAKTSLHRMAAKLYCIIVFRLSVCHLYQDFIYQLWHSVVSDANSQLSIGHQSALKVLVQPVPLASLNVLVASVLQIHANG